MSVIPEPLPEQVKKTFDSRVRFFFWKDSSLIMNLNQCYGFRSICSGFDYSSTETSADIPSRGLATETETDTEGINWAKSEARGVCNFMCNFMMAVLGYFFSTTENLFLCQQDYIKTTELIFMKPGKGLGLGPREFVSVFFQHCTSCLLKWQYYGFASFKYFKTCSA